MKRKNLACCCVLFGAGLGASGAWIQPDPPRQPSRISRPAPSPELHSSPLPQEISLEQARVPRSLPSSLSVPIKSGQRLSLTVQQVGIDVRVEISGPGLEPLIVDSPNSSQGPEPVLLVADSDGSYRISIHPLGPLQPGGTYRVNDLKIVRATRNDRRVAAALRDYYRTRAFLREKKPDWQKIAADFNASIPDLEAAGGPVEARALAWDDLGQVRRNVKDLDGSINAYEKATAFCHQLGWKGREAHAVNEIAQNEKTLLRTEKALGHFRQALDLARESRDPDVTAAVLTNLGVLHADRGEVFLAERYLREATQLYRAQHDVEGQTKALNGLAFFYTRVGDVNRALEIYDQELKLDLNSSRRAVLFTEIGNALVEAGNTDRALQFFTQAFALQKNGALADQAKTLVGFGLAYSWQGKYADALGSYGRALNMFESLKDLDSQIRTYLNIGWALAGMGRYDEANESFKKALSLGPRNSLRNPVLQTAISLGLAWNARRRGNLSEARGQAENALGLIESLRSETQDESMRLSLFAAKQDPYDLLIEILMDQYDRRPDPALIVRAFEVSESARARVLLDRVRERQLGAKNRAQPVLSISEIQDRVLDPETIVLEYFPGTARSYLFFGDEGQCRAIHSTAGSRDREVGP